MDFPSPRSYVFAMFFVIFLILLSEFAQGANEEPDLAHSRTTTASQLVAE